jgi:hypothetical protein
MAIFINPITWEFFFFLQLILLSHLKYVFTFVSPRDLRVVRTRFSMSKQLIQKCQRCKTTWGDFFLTQTKEAGLKITSFGVKTKEKL